MADEPIRVLYRAVAGLPARQASKEEWRALGDLTAQIWEKWKASGVKLIGSFSTYGNAVDGFCHHFILEVDDVRQVHEMQRDIQGGEFGRFIEKYDFHVGYPFGKLEEEWHATQ
jgi:hypothetical protein